MEEEFNVIDIELDGSKLIEASAGTGKTYSVALLVLRLILEKRMPVEKILMVTFTIPAVAELETRIRRFVRLAFRHACGREISETRIRDVVGAPSPEKADLLKKAMQSLDSLSVMTIHSFCHGFITNYPFEAGHSFETELMTDMTALVEYAANDYWRKEINTIQYLEVFRHLRDHIDPKTFARIISAALDDKEYVFDPINREEILNQLRNLINDCNSALTDFTDHISVNWNAISLRASGNRYAAGLIAKCKIPKLFAEEFLEKCKAEKGAPDYFSKYFREELEKATQFIGLENELAVLTETYVGYIFSEIIDRLRQLVNDIKNRRNIISYNDLISVMHEAVLKGSVNDVVLKQYEAVFIDEFQDTDTRQYAIFSELFHQNSTVFYIGDPKQSIYGWRKADIETYKKAANEVGAVARMNENFRSTQDLIHALNALFATENPFSDGKIVYKPVNKGDIELGTMTEAGSVIIPVSVNSFPNNAEIVNHVKKEILRLLTTENILIDGNPVEPSDIAVLTRTNRQAEDVKKALSSVDIPSVTIDKSSVLESPESKTILSLLPVVLNPERGGINKVLLNESFGFRRSDIEKLDSEAHLNIFRELKSTWLGSGIYNMLFQFLDAYQVRKHCLARGIIGQRALSNFYQLAEIMHQVTLKTRYTPEELIVWLQREKDKTSEEYEQRIESEDNAVQILTVHKSKGLTFKIVFAPFLDLRIKEDVDIFSFRTDDGYKFTPWPTEEQLELYRTQTEQENRRLIYVALTRAMYKLYICENLHFGESSLKQFLGVGGPLFERDVVREPLQEKYRRRDCVQAFSPKQKPVNLDINNTFGIHSFSALSKAHHSAPFEKTELGNPEDYDQFIFQDLGRGANVGTALHSIFERLDFTDDTTWDKTLLEASKYYSNIIKEDNLPLFRQMISHVLNAEIDCDGEKFRLKDVANEQKLPELEFLFSISKVNKAIIDQYLGPDASLTGEADLEGLMTGFVDLVFVYKGKYYILDWKSNHMGNDVIRL